MNSILAVNLGATLKVARFEKKMTQKELAEKSGIADKKISKIERGIELPTLEEVFALASALGKEIALI